MGTIVEDGGLDSVARGGQLGVFDVGIDANF